MSSSQHRLATSKLQESVSTDASLAEVPDFSFGEFEGLGEDLDCPGVRVGEVERQPQELVVGPFKLFRLARWIESYSKS